MTARRPHAWPAIASGSSLGDEPGFFQRLEMTAPVPVGDLKGGLEMGDVDLGAGLQSGKDAEAHTLVDVIIEVGAFHRAIALSCALT